MKTRWMGSWMCMWTMAAVAAATAGCSSTKSCADVFCTDGFTATVRRADGSFPTGMHRIEITADRAIFSCTFTFAGPLASGATLIVTCEPSGPYLQVAPSLMCPEVRSGQAFSGCIPIPGQFDETIGLSGTPARVDVRQYVDDVAILDVGVDASYQEYRPNGAGCDPVCRQASVSWTLP